MRFGLALLLAGMVWAQHGCTPADIEARSAGTPPTACHATVGMVLRFRASTWGMASSRRGVTDDELAFIISGGIPGTAMPPFSFAEAQTEMMKAAAWLVVAWALPARALAPT
jgi:hypothetical protein